MVMRKRISKEKYGGPNPTDRIHMTESKKVPVMNFDALSLP